MSGPWNPDGSQWPQQPGQGAGGPQGSQPYGGYGANPGGKPGWGQPAQPHQQPPYQGQPPFQGPQQGWQQPQYQPGAPPKPPQKPWFIIGVVAAVLLIAAGITTLVLVNKDNPSLADPGTSTAVTTSSTSSTTSSTPTTTTSTTTTSTTTTTTTTDIPMVVGTCAEVTGEAENVELVELDCADPSAAYIVIAEGVSAICDETESEFTQNSSFGLSTKTCMSYNVSVDECIKFGETLSDPDTKVDCADYVGDKDTVVTLLTSTETSDDSTCPDETTIYYSYSSRNSLICFGEN